MGLRARFPVAGPAERGHGRPLPWAAAGFARRFRSPEIISLPEQAGEWGCFHPIAQVEAES